MSMDSSSEGYEDAVFISYTHVDNQPFGPDHLCWISHLHEQLTCRVEQLYGERATVWRDEKLHGNDVFARVAGRNGSRRSPCWSPSARRATSTPSGAGGSSTSSSIRAETGLGMQVGTKSRVFKVLKTPVPLDELPDPLRSFLGYEFYEESPVDHRVREYLLNPDPEERWKFYARVDDLAQDIARLLEELARDARRGGTGAAGPDDLPGRVDIGRGAVPGQHEARARAARSPGPAAARAAAGGRGPDGGGERRSVPLGAVDPPPGRSLRRPAGEREPLDPPPPAGPRQRGRPPEADWCS